MDACESVLGVDSGIFAITAVGTVFVAGSATKDDTGCTVTGWAILGLPVTTFLSPIWPNALAPINTNRINPSRVKHKFAMFRSLE